MTSIELELRTLCDGDEEPFKRAVKALENDNPPWTFAFDFDESVVFSDYVDKLDLWSRGQALPEDFVPNTFFVGVVRNIIVGRLSIRHHLNDYLEKIGGHIGYGVIPAYRRQGYATEMLRQAIPVCASLGIEKALVTCDEGNAGSRKVIENCRGIYAGTTSLPELTVQKRRYWITTGPV
ncbi:MAG: GNAT family N-acetyltransferase [Desulfobacteraceae bacterium]|nr:GNAT family N-acetyltransferase [Desulfobacteraceae bacterium]